jgi:hypothetical protein
MYFEHLAEKPQAAAPQTGKLRDEGFCLSLPPLFYQENKMISKANP